MIKENLENKEIVEASDSYLVQEAELQNDTAQLATQPVGAIIDRPQNDIVTVVDTDETSSNNQNPQSEKNDTSKEKKKGTVKKTLKQLVSFCRPWLGFIIAAIVFAMGAVALQLIGPTFVERMVDNMTDGLGYIASGGLFGAADFYYQVVRYGIILVIIYASSFLMGYFQQFIMASVTARVQKSLRKKMSQKINNVPLSYLDSNPTGDTLSRITNDVDTVTNTLNYTASTTITAVCTLVGALIAMFITQWLMALVAVGSALIAFAIMAIITKKSQKYFIRQQQEVGDVNAHIEEYFSGHTAVKTNNARPRASGS